MLRKSINNIKDKRVSQFCNNLCVRKYFCSERLICFRLDLLYKILITFLN